MRTIEQIMKLEDQIVKAANLAGINVVKREDGNQLGLMVNAFDTPREISDKEIIESVIQQVLEKKIKVICDSLYTVEYMDREGYSFHILCE